MLFPYSQPSTEGLTGLRKQNIPEEYARQDSNLHPKHYEYSAPPLSYGRETHYSSEHPNLLNAAMPRSGADICGQQQPLAGFGLSPDLPETCQTATPVPPRRNHAQPVNAASRLFDCPM